MEKREAAEIEITVEMLAAGVLALTQYDRDIETLEEGATRIFMAILQANARQKKEVP
jgi:hypothetical protein